MFRKLLSMTFLYYIAFKLCFFLKKVMIFLNSARFVGYWPALWRFSLKNLYPREMPHTYQYKLEHTAQSQNLFQNL